MPWLLALPDHQQPWYRFVSQQYFPWVSSEQTEHCILAHELQQPTAGCIAIFHKYCCCTKHGSIKIIWLIEIIGGMLLMCQNTTMQVYGAWIKRYCVYVKKHLTPCTVVITSLLVPNKLLRVPASVKRAFWLCRISRSGAHRFHLHVHNFQMSCSDLTHCGLVMPYGDIYLGQHWVR